MKLKNLLSGSRTETIYRADEKFETIQLEKKDATYSYFADPMYVFMDADFNQHEVETDNMGDALNYLEDGMPCEITFYDGRAISVEMPNSCRARGDLHRARGQGRHLGQGDEAGEARHRLRGRRCRCSSAPATGSRSTPAPASTAAGSDRLPPSPAAGASTAPVVIPAAGCRITAVGPRRMTGCRLALQHGFRNRPSGAIGSVAD